MKRLLFLLAIGISCLSGCGGGGGGGSAQAQTATTVVRDVTLAQFTASDTDGVQVAICPSTSSAISASCFCGIPDAGPIFGVEVVGNAAICGCSVGSGGAFNPVDVTVTCSSLIFGQVLSGAAGGIEIHTLPRSQPDAKQVSEWAEKIKAKEAELQNARGRVR